MATRCATSVLVSVAVLTACTIANTPTVPTSSLGDAVAARRNGSYKIYVANIGNSTVTTYDADGTQLTFNPLSGRNADGTISSYKPDGTPTDPTIRVKERGLHAPVDSNGKGPLRSIRDPREAPGGIGAAGGHIYLASSSAYSSVLKTYTFAGRRI